MNETVRQWVDKAERDFATARRELEAVSAPNYDAVCYHAQQCIEKLMKALLIQHGEPPPRTHGLITLNTLLIPLEAEWNAFPDELRFLTRAAVDFRYPGSTADMETAREAVAIATRLRSRLRAFLHLE